jgi:SSS family solute:Na+ symporter
MSQHLNSATMPQFFEGRFDSKKLKLAAAVIIFVFLIPYTASLYNGLSRLFGMAFNIDYSVCVIAMAVLTAIYVIVGGYMATAINDFIQGLVMLVGIVAVILAVMKSHGGVTETFDALSQITDPQVSQRSGVFTSFFGPDPVALLGVVMLTSMGTWGLPQMVQKFYAIKDERSISKGMIISTVFALVVAGGCYFLGGFGRLVFPSTEAMEAAGGYDAIIPTMLSDLSPVLIAIVVVLVLSASMSTLSSLVMASSSTLTLDFIKGTMAKKMSEKKQLLVMRIFIAVFIAISVAIAIVQYKAKLSFIAQLMGISWGALAGSFMAPYLYGLYWKRTSKASVWVCFVFSTLVMVANIVFKGWFPGILQSPINAGVFCMLAGLVIVPVVSLFTKAPEKEHIEQVFSCYDRKVVVSAKEAIGDPVQKEDN